MADWHPKAKRVPYPSAGAYTGGGAKLVWHTTEGSSLPSYKGDAPHFTLNPKTGELWQHVPIGQASSALVHPPQVETNHANCVQVELVEFSSRSPRWTDSEYARIAELARWIEKNHGVPRRATVKFTSTPQRQAERLAPAAWLRYAGHVGHEHVPGNVHWDPGSMLIGKVLDLAAPASNPKLEKWRAGLAKLRRVAAKRKKAGRRPWTLSMRVKARMLKQLIAREEKK